MDNNDARGNFAEYHYGLAFLRLWMAYEIVLGHYWRNREYAGFVFDFIIKFTGVAAPIFMCLSFYLFEEKLVHPSSKIIKKRVYRILYPHFVWLLVYLIYRLLVNWYIGKKMNVMREVFLQALFGASDMLNAAMWFQVSLCVITLLLFLLIQLVGAQYRIVVYVILMIVGFGLEYAGVLGPIIGMLPREAEIACGRTTEMIPIAMLGCIASFVHKKTNNRVNHFIKNGVTGSLSLLGIVIFFFNEDILSTDGYLYSGIGKAGIAVLTVILFSVVPLNSINPLVKRCLRTCATYTLGVYCMHNLVGLTLGKVFERTGFTPYSLMFATGVFLICLATSAALGIIPTKYVKNAIS